MSQAIATYSASRVHFTLVHNSSVRRLVLCASMARDHDEEASNHWLDSRQGNDCRHSCRLGRIIPAYMGSLSWHLAALLDSHARLDFFDLRWFLGFRIWRHSKHTRHHATKPIPPQRIRSLRSVSISAQSDVTRCHHSNVWAGVVRVVGINLFVRFDTVSLPARHRRVHGRTIPREAIWR